MKSFRMECNAIETILKALNFTFSSLLGFFVFKWCIFFAFYIMMYDRHRSIN